MKTKKTLKCWICLLDFTCMFFSCQSPNETSVTKITFEESKNRCLCIWCYQCLEATLKSGPAKSLKYLPGSGVIMRKCSILLVAWYSILFRYNRCIRFGFHNEKDSKVQNIFCLMVERSTESGIQKIQPLGQ